MFIVGLPRTGTKLTQNIISKSVDGLDCFIAENFFLGRFLRPGVRQKMRRMGSMTEDVNLHLFVDAMYSGKFGGEFWEMLVDGSLDFPKEQMTSLLLEGDRTEKAIYEAMLQAGSQGKTCRVQGDKSGSHILHVPTLLNWFPEAKVVHTFRDPRAILASQNKKLLNKLDRKIGRLQRSSKHIHAALLKLVKPAYSLLIVLYITIIWHKVANSHHQYQKQYPENYLLLKYEDLVTEPEGNLKQLCRFLNTEFNEGMLQPERQDSSFGRRGGAGFDQQALNRWRTHLNPWMRTWLNLTSRRQLRRFGYLP